MLWRAVLICVAAAAPQRVQRLIIVRHGMSTYTEGHVGFMPRMTKGKGSTATLNGKELKQMDEGVFRDAPLAAGGQAQADLLAKIFRTKNVLSKVELPLVSQIEVAVASPLSRALQTASTLVNGTNISLIAHPECREYATSEQDHGMEKSIMQEKYSKVNFDEVKNETNWWNGQPHVDVFRKYLASRKENVILLVSHREFLRHFLNQGLSFRFTECGVLEYYLITNDDGSVNIVPSDGNAWVPALWKGGPDRIATFINSNAKLPPGGYVNANLEALVPKVNFKAGNHTYSDAFLQKKLQNDIPIPVIPDKVKSMLPSKVRTEYEAKVESENQRKQKPVPEYQVTRPASLGSEPDFRIPKPQQKATPKQRPAKPQPTPPQTTQTESPTSHNRTFIWPYAKSKIDHMHIGSEEVFPDGQDRDGKGRTLPHVKNLPADLPVLHYTSTCSGFGSMVAVRTRGAKSIETENNLNGGLTGEADVVEGNGELPYAGDVKTKMFRGAPDLVKEVKMRVENKDTGVGDFPAYDGLYCHISDTILGSSIFWRHLGAKVVRGGGSDFVVRNAGMDFNHGRKIMEKSNNLQLVNATLHREKGPNSLIEADNTPTIYLDMVDSGSIYSPAALMQPNTLGYFKHHHWLNAAGLCHSRGDWHMAILGVDKEGKQKNPNLVSPKTLPEAINYLNQHRTDCHTTIPKDQWHKVKVMPFHNSWAAAKVYHFMDKESTIPRGKLMKDRPTDIMYSLDFFYILE